MRAFVLALSAACALLLLPAATAKDFGPGDLRVCNAARCVPIMKRAVLPSIGAFYYSGPPLSLVTRPPLGTPYFELRFRNGYATGIVATHRLDRFLSYGVHLERFARDTWYGVSPRFAQELRGLTAGLRPYRLTRAALAKSR
jgi:hypothetical protein